MEVSSRDPASVFPEDQRVIRNGVDLNVHTAAHIVDRILAGSVDLRTAAQGISVLYADLSLAAGVPASLQEL